LALLRKKLGPGRDDVVRPRSCAPDRVRRHYAAGDEQRWRPHRLELRQWLAPIIVQRIGELLRQLRSSGATVLTPGQNMHFCLGLASHATVIDKGQIVYTSGIEELKANDNIRQRCLAL
jgi:hypothetical protein